ncbi:MAG: peptidoglycan DD-metalloendopeptidase family protein [Candidatus Magasanikbacteria bacterium]|nr:peptidoglycan DD-metalloendopeptidase family protein [Candidatus Magasanikbacteria bacterium]
MKYRVLLKFLRVLVYSKRFFWWVGAGFYFVLGKLLGAIARFFIYLRYKVGYFLKRVGLGQMREWLLKRDFLQMILFIAVVLIGFSQTKFSAQKDMALAVESSAAYTLFGGDPDYVEEVVSNNGQVKTEAPAWKVGTIDMPILVNSGTLLPAQNMEIGTVVAGGTALMSPTIISSATIGATRNQVVNYTIEPGDSLGAIAYAFGVSIPTIMWENNLSLKSIIRPGDIIRIPPITGIMHVVKKGDTLKKIASAYQAAVPDIVRFNHLKEDGSDLQTGERVMVPNGIRPQDREIAAIPRTAKITPTIARQIAAPPSSALPPSASGFVWPSGSRSITQYFGIRHHAIDIAGPWQTPTYAAKAGVVEVAQCGWNSGYGCYVIIDHGSGLKTLYGHNSQILVSPGEQVEAGQTVALMGNTGRVRGVTGIHVHFEVQVNGIRVNPLKYVR